MSRTMCVEGTITAESTATVLNSQGSTTSPTRIVPSQVKIRISDLLIRGYIK